MLFFDFDERDSLPSIIQVSLYEQVWKRWVNNVDNGVHILQVMPMLSWLLEI